MSEVVVEAVGLLRDPNLVWSSDFDGVRYQLADLLIVSAAQGDVMQALAENVARRLIDSYGSSYDPKLELR